MALIYSRTKPGLLKKLGLGKSEAGGQAKVLNVLRELPDTYTVFRGLQPEGWPDIDFTVVGPTGVFTIDYRSDQGLADQKIFDQAKGQAWAIHQFIRQQRNIDAFVIAVTVFSDEAVNLNPGQTLIDGVNVIRPKALLPLITNNVVGKLNLDAINTALVEQEYYAPAPEKSPRFKRGEL